MVPSRVEELPHRIHHPFVGEDLLLWGMDGLLLVRSKDFGSTWRSTFDFRSLGAGPRDAPRSILGMVYASRAGVIFVSLANGMLYRSVDAGATFNPCLVLSSHDATITPWTFTEDSAGTLYAGEYGLQRNENWTSITNYAYLYTSHDEGANWCRSEFFINDGVDRHFHGVCADPFTDRVYVTTGDIRKRMYRSDDGGRTWQRILGHGYTGIAFFRGGRLLGTDYIPKWRLPWPLDGVLRHISYRASKPINEIHWSEDDHSVRCLLRLHFTPYCSPVYDLHTVGDSEAWFVGKESLPGECSMLWRTLDRGQTWELVYAQPPGARDYGPVMLGLAHGRCSTIPEQCPYLIVSQEDEKGNACGPLLRFARKWPNAGEKDEA